jgi:hypothetical protein
VVRQSICSQVTLVRATKSYSARRKSPTLAWRHSKSSTKNALVHSNLVSSLPEVAAAAAAGAKAVVAAAEAAAVGAGVRWWLRWLSGLRRRMLGRLLYIVGRLRLLLGRTEPAFLALA